LAQAQIQDFNLEGEGGKSRTKSQKRRGRGRGAGVLREGVASPSPPARGSEERCKLPSNVQAEPRLANIFYYILSTQNALA